MSSLKLNKLFRIRNQNEKGFSLVELMIALAILALFAIGIISAFSGSFQAMADSKYRTIATNLAQEKLEQVKNTSKDFEYPFFAQYSIDKDGMEFTVITVANDKIYDDENVAEITVTVSWRNRDDVQKDVRLQTLIYNLKIVDKDLPEIGKILLTADKLELICCQEDQFSTIIAEVFDKSGDRLVPSGTPVGFTTDNQGILTKEFALTDSTGRATTELRLKSKNPASVWAFSGGVDCEEEVKVTCEPVIAGILLSASKSTVIPDDISTIIAIVKDSCGNIIEEQVMVEFSTDHGFFNDPPGSQKEVVPTENGEARINFQMSNSEIDQTATIIGTVEPKPNVKLSDSVEVFCSNYSIEITAKDLTIYPDEKTIITATLIQSGGQNPPDNQKISFSTSAGKLSKPYEYTDEGKASVDLSDVPGGETATVTAEYEFQSGKTISASVNVKSQQFIMDIDAEPKFITPDKTSLITVELKDYLKNPISDRLIRFFTNKGFLSTYSTYTDIDGKADTILSELNVNDIAEISATLVEDETVSKTISVTCIDYVLQLEAKPDNITIGNISTITATLKDYLGQALIGKTITFETDLGAFSNGEKTISGDTDSKGEVSKTLTINTSGTATVTASFESAEAKVTVVCAHIKIDLDVIPDITLLSSNRELRFNLKLEGGPLTVNQVMAQWTTIRNNPTRYEGMWISLKTSSDWSRETQIYNRSVNNNGIVQDLNTSYIIPKNSVFRIRMRFSSTINSTRDNRRNFDFTFNPADPGAAINYNVKFVIPRN